jgi:predicted nucleotidyltransferase
MNDPSPRLDVTDAELAIVRKILCVHVPDREVWAFGSRVRGTAKPFSDLDLAVLGDEPLPIDTLAALNEAFGESDLPWKVDVVDWARTESSFRAVIAPNSVAIHPLADAEAQEHS